MHATSSRMASPPWLQHVLLALVLGMMVVIPLGTPMANLVGRLVFTAVILGCMAETWPSRRLFVVSAALGVPALVFGVIGGEGTLALLRHGFSLSILAFASMVRLAAIFRGETKTAASVSGALVVYLFLGIIWWLAYLILEQLQPGAFYGLAPGGGRLEAELFYYSYVTLTTLGYGEIGPLSPSARSLATLQAVIGQLYLAVMVASIVGLVLKQTSVARPEESGASE